MKRLIIILIAVIIGNLINAATFTSIKSGNWSDGLTWNQAGLTPVSGDIVIISNNHIVTVSTTEFAKSITINGTDAANYGTLQITTGADLTTSDNITVYGKLEILDGTLNHGTSLGDKLTVNGTNLGSSCMLSISGGILNISRYFYMNNAASLTMTGGTMNVNNKGGSSSTDIFNIPAGTSFTMSAGTINILNGNLGAGVAMKFNPTTTNITGGTIIFDNTLGYPTTTLISDDPLYNINCNVGSGDTLLIKNMPSSVGGFACNDFTITSGVTKICQGYGITVAGILTNNLGANALVIESTSAGNGSLIASGTVVGTATVQRYIDGYTANNDGWHEISSPVTGMVIGGSDFDPGTSDDLYAWDESGNIWLNYKLGDNNITNFNDGIGYLVAYQTTATKNFTGELNNSDITFNNLTLGDGLGWHLLGNPFASALQWNNDDWTITNIGGVSKVWDESAGNYIDISANGYIPSTNGFFVQAGSSTNTITIPSAASVHNSTNNFKSSENINQEVLIVRITSDGNSFTDECTIGFSQNATELWDIELDSRKLMGTEKSPQLWTVTSEEDLSTNYLPPVYESYILPLNFHAGTDVGNYSLNFDNLESFFANSTIMLEDKLEDIIIDLNEIADYTFTGRETDAPDRFLLHFYGVTNIADPATTLDQYQIYTYGDNIYVKNLNNGIIDGNLTIYNTLGQKIYEEPIIGTGMYAFKTLLNSGYYVTQFTTNNQVISKKILIN